MSDSKRSKKWSSAEVAEFLGVSLRTVEGWRFRGGGPRYRVIGRRTVRYDPEDVFEFAGDVRVSTSDHGSRDVDRSAA